MFSNPEQTIPATCKVPSKYVNVLGSKMHYLQQGKGDPILFLHGMPTSSYLWRNIIPVMSSYGCCIAPDFIGMGKSDKPEIEYTLFDHIRYIDEFIKALNLKKITFVLHGWGSVIGFNYAARFEKNVAGLSFYEAHIKPALERDSLSLPVQQLATLLNRPGASYKAIVEHNYLVKKLLPHGVLRKLSQQELSVYEAPFTTPESRKPLWQYVQELPLGATKGEVVSLIEHYSQWLQQSKVPKLLLYAVPGFTTPIATVQWAIEKLPCLTVKELPGALHFAQESHPYEYADLLKNWYLQQVKK